MAGESNPPPPSGGGMKYGIIGLLLIGGAIGLWFLMEPPEEPKVEAPPPPRDAGVQRSTALAEPDLVIPEEDAGQDAGEPEVEQKIVYKYVRDSWDCSGELGAAQAQSVIRQHQRQVRSCYERRLKVNNALAGRVSLQLRIGRDGSVSGVRVGGNLGDREVFACVRQLAQSWQFPAPQGGRCAVVAAPFNFTPKSP